MIREWRDLHKLMRAGRGHEEDGIAKTGPGDLVVPCRACPHPGINLPDDFEQVPPHLQYLYWQTIAVDCNFRLKNRARPSQIQDIRLSPGWAYVVDHEPYLAHVRQFASQEEVCLSYTPFETLTDSLAVDEYVRGFSGHAARKPQASERPQCNGRGWRRM